MKKMLLVLLGIVLVLGALGLSGASSIFTTSETLQIKEIMNTIERAYDVEAEAAYTFDLSKLPTVFINDPRFKLDLDTLEVVRQLTRNPFLKSAGWLDYKMAIYSWRRDSILQSEAVHAKAKAENRELTKQEKASLVDPWGRTAPARVSGPNRKLPLDFLSASITDDIATVVINYGAITAELKLVLIKNKWYIAGYKGISINP